MKNILVILLLGIYTTFNLGLVVNTHYCCGKIASVSINKTSKNGCGTCGKKTMTKDCCKDTQTQLSMDDTQRSPQSNVEFPACTLVYTPFVISYVIQASDFSSLNEHAIPFYSFNTGPPKTALYIQIQSLLI